MKKFLLAAALAAIAISSRAETKQALTLHMESGATIVYYLDTHPSISFDNQTMVVMADDKSTDIPMQDVNHWEIGEREYTDIESITEVDSFSISVYGNTLTIINPQAAPFAIYNVSGQIVGSGNQCEASYTLPAGIYIISASNNTYKIILR